MAKKSGDSATIIDDIRAGYTFDGPALTMGALLFEGEPVADAHIKLPIGMLNRHGLVAGATGTGKTRTLQLMSEQLSDNGVSVFITDVKGDLSGMMTPGESNSKLLERTTGIGQDWQPAAFPLEILNLGGSDSASTPVRATVTDFGPILLARALELNDTQSQSLQLIFSWADSQGLELLDLKDLRAVITFLTSDEGKEQLKGLGGVSSATAGVILRAVSILESQGGDVFFGEPAFDTTDFIRTDANGKGIISTLYVPDLMRKPALVSTFIMWLLADLFHDLPEVGDADKPKLVFFFDEAHLLFQDASKEFLAQIVQTVKLIRSKGVGIIFVTQTPKDIPADVLGQLGARVQHALRAFTPNDAKALEESVKTFPTGHFDLMQVIPSLGTGEAVITVLDKKGRPTPVAPARLWAPRGVMGPAEPAAIQECVAASTLHHEYKDAVDSYSAFEKLSGQPAPGQATSDAPASAPAGQGSAKSDEGEADQLSNDELEDLILEREPSTKPYPDPADYKPGSAGGSTGGSTGEQGNGVMDALGGMFGNMMKSMGTQLGREISRTIFGTSSTRRRSTKRRSTKRRR